MGERTDHSNLFLKLVRMVLQIFFVLKSENARRIIAGLFAFLLFLLPLSCTKKTEEPTPKKALILARVGNQVITADEFRQSYETAFGHLKSGPNPKQTYLDYMIKERLLAIEGYRMGMDKSERVKRLERRLLNELLIESLLNREIKSKIKITPEEIRREINKSKVSFKFRYWVEDDLEKAKAIAREMRQRGYAEVVDDLLRQNPEKRINPKKYETRYLTYLEISSELLDAIKDLPVGEISDPVLLHRKYYIFQVLDIRRRGITENEYKSKASSFEQIIFHRKYQEAIARYVSTLMEPKQVVTKGESFRLLANALREWEQMDEKERGNFREAVQKSDNRHPALKELKDHLNQTMVSYSGGEISLGDFLKEFNPARVTGKENEHPDFKTRLHNAVKQTIRDHFLAEEAKKKGLQEAPEVRETLTRWRNKWVFNEMREHLTREVNLSKEEVKEYFETHKSRYKMRRDVEPQLAGFLQQARLDALREKERQILNRKIEALMKKYPMEINQTVLDTLTVVDFKKSRWATFQVFQMGTNRPASPTVDPGWAE